MDLADVAHRTTLERLAHLADVPGAEIRRGAGWFAVRTGMSSNDDNVVLSASDARLETGEIDGILEWMRGVPATWNVDAVDDRLTRMLLARGARSERTGWWCGRALDPPAEPEPGVPGRRVTALAEDGPAAGYLEVLQACGWFDGAEREARRAALEWHPSFRHVMATDAGRVVGVATGFAGTALEIVDVAVLPEARRGGVAGALTGDLERWAAALRADTVYAAPSPDGAELFRALGFAFARVQPDVCFYLP